MGLDPASPNCLREGKLIFSHIGLDAGKIGLAKFSYTRNFSEFPSPRCSYGRETGNPQHLLLDATFLTGEVSLP